MFRNALLPLALCLSFAPAMTEPAAAQWGSDSWSGANAYRERPRTRPKARPTLPDRSRPEAASIRKADGPLIAVVSISEQKIALHDSNGLIARSSVSTGQAGHRTPTGVFSIIQKNKWHRSNIYSGAPMPYMQRITWSGIALHEGALPGYPASHGCIRLPRSFAVQLWGMTRLGVRVVVAPHDAAPLPFDNAALPKPAFFPTPVAEAAEVAAPARLAEAGSSATTTDGGDDMRPESSRHLNPAQHALAERTRARQAAAEAIKAAKAAHDASLRASADAREAAVELRRAEVRLVSVREEDRAAVEQALVEVRTREDERAAAAFTAGRQAREAEDASEAAAQAAKAAERATEPLQVFISRKERKLYVRQGFVAVFEAPVTFKDPERALGTHVFTAIGTDAGGKSLRWSSLTVPEQGGAVVREPVRKGQKAPAAAAPAAALSATAALESVIIPEAVQQRLNERVWVGASLIVSDHPNSNETGLGTDFIVLTK